MMKRVVRRILLVVAIVMLFAPPVQAKTSYDPLQFYRDRKILIWDKEIKSELFSGGVSIMYP